MTDDRKPFHRAYGRRRLVCPERFSPTPDRDPEPIYRCMGPEGHEPPHRWDMEHPWLLEQQSALPTRRLAVIYEEPR